MMFDVQLGRRSPRDAKTRYDMLVAIGGCGLKWEGRATAYLELAGRMQQWRAATSQ